MGEPVGAGRRPVVLSSLRAVRPTTNPYVVELNRWLAEDADVRLFSWRRFLLGRWDVLHVHWPEVLVRRRSAPRTAAAAVLVVLGVLRARLTGRPVVRTVHNLRPHEEPTATVAAALRVLDGATAGWIVLTDRTPVPGRGAVVTIPHGTYAPWYAHAPHPPRVHGRLVHVGLVRPYKGVETLLRVFGEVADPALSLRVCGSAQDEAYAHRLQALAADVPRARLDLRHLPDDELATVVRRAELVVLPYEHMHNSGAVLLALSLGRPVLVPANAVNDDLAAELGEVWVQRYTGRLDAARLTGALEAVRGLSGEPDLSARAWPVIAQQHLAFFRRLVGGARSSAGQGAPQGPATSRVGRR